MTLELQTVTKTFIQGNTGTDALKEVNLKIRKNTFNVIIGPSGSGKSTLISLASLLAVPTHGEIIINGIHTSQLSEPDKSLIRRSELGIIYQRENLFPFLTVMENVTVPSICKNKETAAQMLNEIGLSLHDKYPLDISLFDQQKTALARALVNDPSIILADEPTGELNSGETENYLNLINDFKGNSAVLVVTDNPELEEFFDNVFYLNEGMLTGK